MKDMVSMRKTRPLAPVAGRETGCGASVAGGSDFLNDDDLRGGKILVYQHRERVRACPELPMR